MTTLPDPSILVIDDEEANVALLGAILQHAGYRRVQKTTDPIHGVQLAEAATPDLILLDLSMPILDGYGVMERLRAAQAPGSFLPILILTADVNPKTRRRALAGGATDFVTKPFDNDEVVLRCKNLLATRALHLALQGQNARLEDTVRVRTDELERTLVELKAAQQQQVQQERLRALGEMSNGVANDFNNQLTVLVGYSDLLLLNDAQILNNKPMALRYLQTIHTAAHDSVRVVARLRDFYRPREADDVFLPIDLPKLVQETAMLTQPKWRSQARAAGRSVTVKLELTVVPDVAGNAAELREVVTNLIFNAVDAMAVDGTITLRTRLADEGTALLEVADTGVGMTEPIRARCLEPFFTTKAEAGAGLGLSMVYGIIQRHEGSLDIQTQPGHGTTVSIHLPLARNALDAAGVAASEQHAVRPLRVLLVEEDPMVREVVSEYLRRDQHEVSTAITGREGLAKFEAGAFDLVVTDLALEELNGERLAAAIKAHTPAMPVILLTGFADSVVSPDHKPAGIDAVLRKPLEPSALWRAMAQVMTAN